MPHSRFVSTSTGSARAWWITLGTAWKVNALVRILSPGSTPAMLSAMYIAEPQELVPMACFMPMNSAKFFSKRAVSDSSLVGGW